MVTIPHDRLPSAPGARHGALRDYFCDKDATARRTEEGWRLLLGWSDDVDRHVDPRLDVGLAWWGEHVVRSAMAGARRREGKILSALYDTWTVHSWSEWLAPRNGELREPLLILHVDDHRDIGAPRLAVEAGRYSDLLTGATVSLTEPDSVLAAIDSGALGMGSILTPFLHAMPRAQVRHLCQPPKARTTTDFQIVASTEFDTLLKPELVRPAIRLEPRSGVIDERAFRTTPDVDHWLADAPEVPALLHIDMDYFNNRYDGDGDWPSREETLDPDIDAIFAKIDELSEALHRAPVARRIEDIVIAYSPGFFPAEFWAAAGDRLQRNLKSLP